MTPNELSLTDRCHYTRICAARALARYADPDIRRRTMPALRAAMLHDLDALTLADGAARTARDMARSMRDYYANSTDPREFYGAQATWYAIEAVSRLLCGDHAADIYHAHAMRAARTAAACAANARACKTRRPNKQRDMKTAQVAARAETDWQQRILARIADQAR
jgi:hypothetical protein